MYNTFLLFSFFTGNLANFKKYKLTGKGTYEKNYELLFNIHIMCFIKKDKIENFYKKKKNFKEEKYKNFYLF